MIKDFLRTAQRLVNLRVTVKPQPVITSFSDKITTFGSCFAQNIKAHLDEYGFDCYFNRYICAHYSAASIANRLDLLAKDAGLDEDDLTFFKDKRGGLLPYQYFFKARIYGEGNVDYARKLITRINAECRERVKQSQIFIITLGTARIVRLKRNGKIMSIVSGVSKDECVSKTTSVEENVADLHTIYDSLRHIKQSDDFTVFFTVSPQRYNWVKAYLDDPCPFVDNNLNKSILHVAVHQFLNSMQSDRLIYFPSYEIVIDELRNYETLSGYDFLHINQEYTPRHVVKRFIKAFVAPELKRQLPLVDETVVILNNLTRDLAHNLDCADEYFLDEIDKVLTRLREAAPSDKFNPFILRKLYGILAQAGKADLLPEFGGWLEGWLKDNGYSFMIWGTGGFYRDYYAEFIRRRGDKVNFLGFVDADPNKQGTSLDGYAVHAPEAIGDIKPDLIIIASCFGDQISRRIGELKYEGIVRHLH